MRVPSTDGVELALHDLGGQGPPLLLCHATGFHGRVWAPLAGHLADRFHLWALDFRGHGSSTRPRHDDFHWSGFADDVLAVVDALDPRPAVAFGHSKGGAALLLAEQARPGTFRAIATYEPIVFPPDVASALDDAEEHPLAAGAARRRDRFPTVHAAFQQYASKPPLAALAPAALRAYVEHGFVTTPDDDVRLACRPADEAAVYRAGTTHDAWDRLHEVRCPVTVAAGGRTTSVTPELARRIAEGLPAGRLEVFDDLGHFGPLEDPARVAETVAADLLRSA